MAQFTVRNLEDDVRDRLRELAQSHGQSMEETVREILRAAVAKRRPAAKPLGSRIAARFRGLKELPAGGLPIEELRGQAVRDPGFAP